MGYKLIRQEDFNTYTIKHFQCDALTDRATIVSDYSGVTGKNALHAGWTATVTANDSTVSFVLGNDLSSWTEVAFSKGGDPGSGYYPLIASTDSVMTTNENGDPATIPYSADADPNTFPIRDDDGEIAVGTPTKSTSAVNKESLEDGTVVPKHAEIADEANSLATTLGVTDETPTAMQPVGGSSDVTTTYQKLNKLVGCKVVKNQLANLSTDIPDTTTNGITISRTNGIYHIRGTATATTFNIAGVLVRNLNIGHKYALITNVIGTAQGSLVWQIYSASPTPAIYLIENQIITSSSTDFEYRVAVYNGETVDAYFTLQIIDLTLRYGNNDVVNAIIGNDSSKYVEKLLAFDPNIFVDTAYDTGSFSSCKSATLRTVDYNQWDEVAEVGSISGDDGSLVTDNSKLRSKNPIRVLQNRLYYVYNGGSGNIYVYQYDANGDFIKSQQVTNTTFTTASNCFFIRFRTTDTYGTTYNHDICIFLYWDGSRIGYEPSRINNYPMPNKDMNGLLVVKNGKVVADGDEEYPSGEGNAKNYLDALDLGTLDWYGSSYEGLFYSSVVQDMNASTEAEVKQKIRTTKYPTSITLVINHNMNDKSVLISGGRIYLKDTAYSAYTGSQVKSALSGVMAYLPLATPTALTASTFTSTFYGDDFGTMWFLDEDGNVIDGLQGNEIFYKANVAGFAESLYSKTDGDPDDVVVQNDLSGYVQKQTGVTTYAQVYGKATDGAQTMFNMTTEVEGNTVARRTSSGLLRCANAQSSEDAVNLGYADGRYLAKQTGTSTYAQVYVKNADGTQSMIPVTSSRVSDSIVQRTSTGAQITVPETPTEAYHAASKAYVDGKLTATLTQLSDGTYSLTFGV